MANKRIIGIGLAAILAVGVAAVVITGQPNANQDPAQAGGDLSVVTGVVGSEKRPFFEDPKVKAVFAEHGLDVQITTAGSRQIATTVDLTAQDFVFPSSAPAADKIKAEAKTKSTYAPFYSPMAIATFQPVVEVLAAGGIASQDGSGTWNLNMEAYLAAVEAGTRWNQLPGADTKYPSTRSLMISSTDVRQSNSAGMYLALASYVANGNNVVSTVEQQDAVLAQVSSLFLAQGYSESSSDAPFEDYLAQGAGSKPMVMVYEAQFLGAQMAGRATADMVLMYPSPTVFSKHTVVPLTDNGTLVGELLETDERLAALAAEHGFRPTDNTVFTDTLAEHNSEAPALPVNVIDPPSYETLEAMITRISDQYTTPAAPVDNGH